MRIAFMGTPNFAVAALAALWENGHEISVVVTQPDKKKGRGKELQCSPVKEYAMAQGIPVFQPTKIKTPEAIEELRSYPADLFVVAAFGQILSKEILEMPKFGCINIHASLLPKYRGAAPIQRAILEGETQTGITIQQMDEGIDTGDILCEIAVAIDAKETGDSLHDRLGVLGAELIIKAIGAIELGKAIPISQNHEESSYAKMLNKAMGEIDWTKDTVVIERMVRALNSWPSAFTFWNQKTLKIWEAEVVVGSTDKQPGMITRVEKDRFRVATGDGELEVLQVQLEGKKCMGVREFLLGNTLQEGMCFGR